MTGVINDSLWKVLSPQKPKAKVLMVLIRLHGCKGRYEPSRLQMQQKVFLHNCWNGFWLLHTESTNFFSNTAWSICGIILHNTVTDLGPHWLFSNVVFCSTSQSIFSTVIKYLIYLRGLKLWKKFPDIFITILSCAEKNSIHEELWLMIKFFVPIFYIWVYSGVLYVSMN